jgi:branched-chain amino acid transport system ATP-binding protein
MLEIANLHAGYGAIPVLNDVSLRVGAGEFVAIVGPNGAGKTTLFKTISGIVRPTRGAIRFEGTDLASVPAHGRARLGIAHVPEGRQVFPSMTILENLEMGAYAPAGRRVWRENVERIYGWFPLLKERSSALAGSLSGGQQQMLAVARGLASAPRLLMLDEPSMLLVEQRVAEALHFADRGYVVEAGRVVLEGTHETLQKDDRVRQAYLGM